jgi:hypothetical protein
MGVCQWHVNVRELFEAEDDGGSGSISPGAGWDELSTDRLKLLVLVDTLRVSLHTNDIPGLQKGSGSFGRYCAQIRGQRVDWRE